MISFPWDNPANKEVAEQVRDMVKDFFWNNFEDNFLKLLFEND